MAETCIPDSNDMEREIVLTRVFNAPRSLVFQAWTEPKHLMQWWGPHGFTNPECDVDLRVGGAFRIVMRGPDGVAYPMDAIYQEIVEPERLVFTATARNGEGTACLEARTTAVFDDQDGKTKLTVTQSAVGLVPAAARMLAGMEIGWSQSLERLESYVASV